MHTVTLGKAGPDVSAIGLGCMGMSEFYGPASDSRSLEVLARARDLGVTFIDTSDAYGVGDNERLIGRFLAGGHRDEMILATKFGAVRDPQTRALLGLRADPEYVRQACDASLRRLGVEHIDLYYLHVPDPKVPIEETTGAMADLVAAGKVRHLGLSNVSADQLRLSHAVHPITTVQNEWSLFSREQETAVVPACAELGIGFVAYSPLSRGFLTDVYTSRSGLSDTDVRRTVPRFEDANAVHNSRLLAPLRIIAKTHGATAGQVALAWLMLQADRHHLTVVPIPGTKHPARLAENAAAADLRLSEAELALLEPVAAQVLGSGRHAVPAAAQHRQS